MLFILLRSYHMAVGVSCVLYCAVPLIRRVFRGVGYAAGMRKKSVQGAQMPGVRQRDDHTRLERLGRSTTALRHMRAHSGDPGPTRRVEQLDEFLDWLLEGRAQRRRRERAQLPQTRMGLVPGLARSIEPDGVVHHTVMADGTHMNWCLLVAIDGEDGEVLALAVVRP